MDEFSLKFTDMSAEKQKEYLVFSGYNYREDLLNQEGDVVLLKITNDALLKK